MCEPSPLTNPELPVHVWITGQITECRHLLNNYPDLYWATVFAFFAAGDNEPDQWITQLCLPNPAQPGVPFVAAVVPTLLDLHGLVPARDSHQNTPNADLSCRHLPRTRVDALHETFYQDLIFYGGFRPESQLDADDYNLREQGIPIDACEGALVLFTEFDRRNALIGFTAYRTLHRECLWRESHLFNAWLDRRLHRGQNPNVLYANQGDERRVQRFRLGFVMTILPQFSRIISQMKGRAYDLEPDIDAAMAQKIDHHRLWTNRDRRVLYMATMLKLLYHSNDFEDAVGPLANVARQNLQNNHFILYLNLIGVTEPEWNVDWPEAARRAAQMQLPPQEIIFEFNLADHGPHWTLLKLISILPQQMTSGRFMEQFVDSMVENVLHQDRNLQRLNYPVLPEDSTRLQREELNLAEGDPEPEAFIDPLDVRAKIVWLLFMMPFAEQMHPQAFPLGQNPRGGGAAGARGRGGPRNRPGGQGRGGQGQIPPHPPLNQAIFDAHYGNQLATGADTQDRASGAMNGEIDGSEAKKLQDELDDPIEKSFNDLNGSLSQLHLNTTA